MLPPAVEDNSTAEREGNSVIEIEDNSGREDNSAIEVEDNLSAQREKGASPVNRVIRSLVQSTVAKKNRLYLPAPSKINAHQLGWVSLLLVVSLNSLSPTTQPRGR